MHRSSCTGSAMRWRAATSMPPYWTRCGFAWLSNKAMRAGAAMNKVAIESVDVAIVGGGITGCATAWHLAARGIRVALFERTGIAAEQSSRAWGFIRQQGRHAAEVPLATEANRLWVDIT